MTSKLEAMEQETKTAFDNLKELITEKFDNFEKRQELRDENTHLRLANLEAKDKEQDAKMLAMDKKIEHIAGQQAERGNKAIASIKEKVLSWAVPTVILAVIYAVMNGFKFGG